MSVVGESHDRLVQQLGYLGRGFILTDLGQTDACLKMEDLCALAGSEGGQDDPRGHVTDCARCSTIVAAFRSVKCVRKKPNRWRVRLGGVRFPSESEWSYEVVGHIHLATDQFVVCADDAEWIPHPLTVRVNIILDTGSGLFTVTLLEVPSEVRGISILLGEAAHELNGEWGGGTFELIQQLASSDENDLMPRFEHLVELLESGNTDLLFEKDFAPEPSGPRPAGHEDILAQERVIERGYDYVLPCGKHTDTFINIARLCHSEGALARVASGLRELLEDLTFDTIVTNGWAMATLARRVASLWPRATRRPLREIMCEGYDPPVPTEDIAAGSRVLILVDVVVTGSLVGRLRRIVCDAGASVVAAASVARASVEGTRDTASIRSLCTVSMRLDDAAECPRCVTHERLEFNSYANCMTVKLSDARSPSQFIAYNDEAREFWGMVDTADAYEKHLVERNCHYTAFVDTARLLSHADIGPVLVERLRAKILGHSTVPTALLAPRRQRAQLLTARLFEALELATPDGRLVTAFASRRNEAWHLTDAARWRLEGKRVLVIDSAAGHGRTIDFLTSAAMRAGAKSVGAAVLLSRLTESCEIAFEARLAGGFFRLFHLPIRPVVIRGPDPSLCPVCRRKAAVRQAATESGLEAIQWWADRLSHSVRSKDVSTTATAALPKSNEQPPLFPLPETSFLERCRASVAGGVTLHSLHAAMRNGMAPLSLPEIRDETIPTKNRTAMVESLPAGVIAWSRGFLEHDLLHFLAAGRTTSLWRASAEVLARETVTEWISHLPDILRHANALRHKPMPMFWSSIACDAYLIVHHDPSARKRIKKLLEALVKDYEKTVAGDGLRQVLAAINT